MSNFDKALDACLSLEHDDGDAPDSLDYVRALQQAGLLMPDMQIIRTLEEVEALDSYALLTDKDGGLYNRDGILENLTPENMGKYMPLAVLVTREQFRAAREAMGKEHE